MQHRAFYFLPGPTLSQGPYFKLPQFVTCIVHRRFDLPRVAQLHWQPSHKSPSPPPPTPTFSAMKSLSSKQEKLSRNVQKWLKAVSALPKRTLAVYASMTIIVFWLVFDPSIVGSGSLSGGDWTAYGAGMLRYRASLERQYSHVLVKECISRLPSGGRTTNTKVRGVGVSYVSWASKPESSIPSLRAYPPVRVMSKFKRPATLLDIGANIGKITFPTMALLEPHTVIAVEPVRKNMDALCMGANLNGWNGHPNLILVEAAMSDNDGDMKIFVPDGREDNAALSSDAATANVHVSQHAETIHTVSGDKFLAAGGFEPDVIKIDVQGHELFVLKGLTRYLARAKRTLVIAESDPKLMKNSGVDPADVYDLMVNQLGYTPYYHLDVETKDGILTVSGEEIPKDIYPTRTVRDIYYFKKQS